MSKSRFVGDSFSEGLRTPHYLNGRLLTAEDLQADQEAGLARLALVGRAAGAGVIEGLMVQRLDASRLWVSPGSGLNGDGQPVRLASPGATLAIHITLDPAAAEAGGRFQDCAVSAGGMPMAEGAYLLTVVPASRLEGAVPLKAAPAYGNITPCASRWEVEGLQFKAIQLTGFDVTATTAQTRRNLLAHWCFGSEALKLMPWDPFDFPASYAGLDLLSLADFSGCDLPLAVFYWTPTGIAFVDNWSARRRLTLPYPADRWAVMLSDRRVAQSQARFLQFQDQLGMFANPSTVVARDHFRYLPPAGFMPAKPPFLVVKRLCRRLIEAALSVRGGQVPDAEIRERVNELTLAVKTALDKFPNYGFDLLTFFGDLLPKRFGLVERETVEFRLNRSWYDEAIDLDLKPSFDLYFVEDNILLFIAAVYLEGVVDKLAEKTTGEKNHRQWAVVRGFLIAILKDLVRLDEGLIEERISSVDPSGLYVMFAKRVAPVRYVSLRQAKPAAPPEEDAAVAQPVLETGMAARPTAPTGTVSATHVEEAVEEVIMLAKAPNAMAAYTNPQVWEIANTIGLINLTPGEIDLPGNPVP